MKFKIPLLFLLLTSWSYGTVNVLMYYDPLGNNADLIAASTATTKIQLNSAAELQAADLSSVDKLFLTPYNDSDAVLTALQNRSSSLNTFVENGGEFIMSNSQRNTTMDDYIGLFDATLAAPSINTSVGNNVAFANTAAAASLQNGSAGTVDASGLFVNYTYHYTTSASDLQTLQGYQTIIHASTNSDQVAAFSFTKGSGSIYLDSMTTALFGNYGTNSDEEKYVGNLLDASLIPEPNSIILIGFSACFVLVRRRR